MVVFNAWHGWCGHKRAPMVTLHRGSRLGLVGVWVVSWQFACVFHFVYPPSYFLNYQFNAEIKVPDQKIHFTDVINIVTLTFLTESLIQQENLYRTSTLEWLFQNKHKPNLQHIFNLWVYLLNIEKITLGTAVAKGRRVMYECWADSTSQTSGLNPP